jgi:hypothetical protein
MQSDGWQACVAQRHIERAADLIDRVVPAYLVDEQRLPTSRSPLVAVPSGWRPRPK